MRGATPVANRWYRNLRRASGPVECSPRHGHGCGLMYPSHVIEIDHIKPLWNGGLDIDVNLQFLCRDCHKIKTAKEATERASKHRPMD